MRFLIVRVGGTFESLKESRGDYDDWFRASLGVGQDDAPDVAPMEGDPLPVETAEFSGIVVTGSAALVTDREAWSETTGAWLAKQVEQAQVPVLAVCYGHQLLAHALGGEVGHNPHGRQIGSVEVTLTQAGADDPLVGALPNPHVQQASHVQSVLTPPPGAVVLGSTPRDPHHVLRFGPRAWGVQFHPEFDNAVVRTYIDERRERIRAEGQDPEQLERDILPTAEGRHLLRRFRTLCEGSGANARESGRTTERP